MKFRASCESNCWCSKVIFYLFFLLVPDVKLWKPHCISLWGQSMTCFGCFSAPGKQNMKFRGWAAFWKDSMLQCHEVQRSASHCCHKLSAWKCQMGNDYTEKGLSKKCCICRCMQTCTQTVLTVELRIILQFLEVFFLPHTEIIEKLLIWEITYTVLKSFLTNKSPYL